MHWAAKYIGLPYAPAARGPKAVDCWGLVYLAYWQEFKIELPYYPGIPIEQPIECVTTISKGLKQDWVQVETPFEAAFVAMSERDAIHHIGLYLECRGGLVLHCRPGVNVVAEKIRQIKFRGIRKIEFYRYRLWPT